jgi:Protein of unknown function (DUF2971)
MSLYKFISIEVGKKILSNLAIRFTQPSAFNDPFDCHPKLDLKISGDIFTSNQEIMNFLKEYLLSSINSKIPIIKYLSREKKGNMITSQILNKETLETYINNFFSNINNKNEVESMVLKDFISQKFGVLSLSTCWNNHLMWSHYADFQYGIAIEFDDNAEYFKQQSDFQFSKINKVKYTKNRPKFEFQIKNIDSFIAHQNTGNIFLYKSEDWFYEQEYRMIRILNDKYKTELKDDKGFDIYLYPITNSIIKSVLFGLRTPQNEIDEIMKLAKKTYPKIKFYKVLPKSKSYNFKKIKI